MDENDRLRSARDQLTLVLSFFPRVDTKLSVVLGLDLALLAVAASRLPALEQLTILEWVAASIFTLLVGLSLWRLYEGSFPQLEGGHDSLVYFREIAKRTEARFVDQFCSITPQDLARDVLGQVWRNSEILRRKFDHLKWAYRFMVTSVVPWAFLIASLTK